MNWLKNHLCVSKGVPKIKNVRGLRPLKAIAQVVIMTISNQTWSKRYIAWNWLIRLRVHINGLVQERRNSSVLAMELRLSCNTPSIHNQIQFWARRYRLILLIEQFERKTSLHFQLFISCNQQLNLTQKIYHFEMIDTISCTVTDRGSDSISCKASQFLKISPSWRYQVWNNVSFFISIVENAGTATIT